MTDTIRGAMIGFVGIIIGTLLASGASYLQWTEQKKYEEMKHKREQKTYLIKEASEIITKSGRVKGLVAGHMMQINAAKAISNICIAATIAGEQSKNCDLTEANKVMNEFNKEIFESTAKFKSIKQLSRIYFCEETSRAFDNVDNNNQAWWDANNEQKTAILKAMEKEMTCNPNIM